MSSRGLPALQNDSELSRYLTEIRKFPLLTPEDEYMFAKSLKEHGDAQALLRAAEQHAKRWIRRPGEDVGQRSGR